MSRLENAMPAGARSLQQLQLRAYLYGVIWRDVLPYRRRCEQPVKMIRLLFAALLVLSSTFAWGET
ncbi:MAG: hypothetical protein ACTS5Y_09655, partial [Pollutimonas bauzanensis]